MRSSHTRKSPSPLGALVLGVAMGLALGAGAPRAAAEQARPEQKKGAAKAGDRCKKTSDCDQSSGNLICDTVGDHKECVASRPVPPPAT